MTYHHHAHNFNKLIKSAGGFVQRQVTGPYHITVDPVSGDDSPTNDGTTTPLKTIRALAERLPLAVQVASTGTQFDPADNTVSVLLKAGEHRIDLDPDDAWAGLSIDFGSVALFGELSAGVSFLLDSWSTGYVKVHKPAGDPAWVADEHVGKVLDAPIDWGPPWGVYHYQWFIIANDSHSLTVAFSYSGDPLGWSDYIPIGSTLTIKELATKWVGPRIVNPTGTSSPWRFPTFNQIEFQTTPELPMYRALFEQWSGTIAFAGCAFVCDPTRGTFCDIRSPLAHQSHSGCFYRNTFGGVEVIGGNLDMSDVAAVNCQRIWEAGGTVKISGGRTLYLRNCGDVFFGNGCSGSLEWDIYDVYCDSVGYLLFSNIGNLNIFVRGWYVRIPDPTKLPFSFFSLNDGNRLMVRGWSTEALYDYFTFMLGGYGSFPQVTFSVADLTALYGKHYDAGFGCEVLAN
jgi:hypothetical protein